MRCKPGDLAIIVIDPCVVDLGKIVKVILWVDDYYQWLCQSEGGDLAALYGDGPANECCLDDAWLLPIRPSEEPVMVGQLEGIKERV